MNSSVSHVMDYFGGVYVINLDRRPDRLDEITDELDRIGLPFKRFAAIDRKPGILGCGLSHLAVLKEARSLGLKNVLIFEDDFMFSVGKDAFWEKIAGLSGTDFDVCMLAYKLDLFQAHTDLLVKVLDAQTASAYIVNQCFYDTLISLYEEAMPLLETTGRHWDYANDQVWKQLQPRSRWYAFKERLGKQRPSWSDNTESYMDYGI